jgi:hypothetical protein
VGSGSEKLDHPVALRIDPLNAGSTVALCETLLAERE